MRAFLLILFLSSVLSQEYETVVETEETHDGEPQGSETVVTSKPIGEQGVVEEVITSKPSKPKAYIPSCGAPLTALSEKFGQKLVDEHNKYRAKENAGLGKMVWDRHLARRAQELANTCVTNHDLTTLCNGEKLGQNLYAETIFNISAPVYHWWIEKNHYDMNSLSCDPGKQCGHYTQVVWRTSKRVGCAIKSCGDRIWGTGSSYYFVCDYSPAGNYEGQKPY